LALVATSATVQQAGQPAWLRDGRVWLALLALYYLVVKFAFTGRHGKATSDFRHINRTRIGAMLAGLISRL
jgi:hypothetical protein